MISRAVSDVFEKLLRSLKQTSVCGRNTHTIAESELKFSPSPRTRDKKIKREGSKPDADENVFDHVSAACHGQQQTKVCRAHSVALEKISLVCLAKVEPTLFIVVDENEHRRLSHVWQVCLETIDNERALDSIRESSTEAN